jgi:predicted GIY-YIG superfamily endonuclease
MFYVYCIESLSLPGQQYTGFTGDLRQRVADHNDGCNPSTAPGRPWSLKGYVAFDNKPAALDFERYLKTGSGHAFRKKRLW